MTLTLRSLSIWQRALLVLAAGVLLAMPVMVSHYQSAHAPPPAVSAVADNPVSERKAALINTLLPLIQANNRELMSQRERVEKLRQRALDGKALHSRDWRWLKDLAPDYRMKVPKDNPPPASFMDKLLTRLDLIPASLALAQAAMESAWGTSRFARDGNNYFGQWCFSKGCGIVPTQRAEGATHEVARFKSAKQGVQGYMRNLNSHPGYRSLRALRRQARDEGNEPTGMAMAAGLKSYSGIGDAYIRAIRALIRSNELDRFPSL